MPVDPTPKRPKINREVLAVLIRDAYAEWHRAADLHGPLVIPPNSSPVLWFGDLERYLASPVRILTIGVNPGPGTFPTADPRKHYPELGDGANPTPETYTQAMSGFPLGEWFPRWNGLLEPFGARYPLDRAQQNCPLHVDLTPLATVDGFSCVDAAVRSDLLHAGIHLLARLLDCIQPQVSYVSVRDDYFRIVEDLCNVADIAPWNWGAHSGKRARWDCPGEFLWLRKTGASPVSPGRKVQLALGQWMAVPADPQGQVNQPDFSEVDCGVGDGSGNPHVEQASIGRQPAAGKVDRRPLGPSKQQLVAALENALKTPDFERKYVQLAKKSNASLHDFLPRSWILKNSGGKHSKQVLALSLQSCPGGVRLAAYVQPTAVADLATELLAALSAEDWVGGHAHDGFVEFWQETECLNGDYEDLEGPISRLIAAFETNVESSVNSCLDRSGVCGLL